MRAAMHMREPTPEPSHPRACRHSSHQIYKYFEEEWLCATWRKAWTDWARSAFDALWEKMLRNFPTTDNSTERLWIRYLKDCCRYIMFKRLDHELNHITNGYGNIKSCFLDMLELAERNAVQVPPPSL